MPEEAGTLFDGFPITGIRYWCMKAGGWGTEVASLSQLSWEYDDAGPVASRELCTQRDLGQLQVSLASCHVGVSRQKGDG